MGMFDKLKNAVTGGAANVYVDVGEATRGEPFEVTVRAQAQNSDVKYDRVYLYVRGIEYVEVPDADLVRDNDGDVHRQHELVRASGTTWEYETNVAAAGVLGANQTEEWTVQVEIPATATPEYSGRFTDHSYKVFAGMDCFGNDPDSDWIRITVN